MQRISDEALRRRVERLCPSCGREGVPGCGYSHHPHIPESELDLLDARAEIVTMRAAYTTLLAERDGAVSLCTQAERTLARAIEAGVRAGLDEAADICDSYASIEGIAQRCRAEILGIDIATIAAGVKLEAAGDGPAQR